MKTDHHLDPGKIEKNGFAAKPQKYDKDGSTCEDWQALSLVFMLNGVLVTTVSSLCECVFVMCLTLA